MPPFIYGDQDFDLTNYTTVPYSGNQVTFESSNQDVVVIVDGKIHIVGAGEATITASVAEDNYYFGYQTSQQAFVSQAFQFVTFNELPSTVYAGTTIPLSASASSGLDVDFYLSDPSVGYVEGSILVLTSPGFSLVNAEQPGDNNYYPADLAYQYLYVNAAQPTVQSSALAFENVTATELTLTATPGDGTGRLIIMNPSGAVDFIPSDNNYYYAGQTIGSNLILSVDNSSFATLQDLTPSATYYFKVYEYNEMSGYISYLTANAPATSRTVGALGKSYVMSPVSGAINQKYLKLTVTAAAVTSVSSYTIELNTAPDFSGASLVKTGSRAQVFDELAYNTTYYTRVKAGSAANYGQIKYFTTAGPEYFAKVTAPVNGATGLANTVSVHSATVPGASSYTIAISSSPAFTSDVITKNGSSSQKFTGLTYGTTYYVRVTTDISDVPGPVSTFTVISAASAAYMTTPTNGAVNQVWNLNITSSSVTGATSYTIQISPVSDFSSGVIQKIGARTQLFSGLAFDTKYYCRIATNASVGNFGPVKNFTIAKAESRTYMKSPENHTKNASTNTKITSTLIPGATTYTIELNTNSTFTGTSIVKIGGQIIPFTSLAPFTTYYVRIATNVAPGLWGPTRDFTTRGLPPGRLAIEPGLLNESEDASASAFEVLVNGNPFKSKLSFVVRNSADENASVKLLNLNGKVVHQSIEATNKTIEIEKDFSNGIYVLHVRVGSRFKAIRVLRMD